MTVERVDFDHAPAEPVRRVWAGWLRRHGVDPSDVLATGWIERRPDDYQLAYLSIGRDPSGKLIYDGDRDDLVYVERVFQMEGPPLPFPNLEASQ